MSLNFSIFTRCLYRNDLQKSNVMQEEQVRANLRVGVGVFIVCSNLLLIVGLLKSRRRSSLISRANKLMILLSSNDMSFGFLNLVPIEKMSNDNNFACHFKVFYDACTSFGLIFGTEIFLDIALLRCISVLRPFYRISSKVLILGILVQGIFSFSTFIFNYLIYFENISVTHIGWIVMVISTYIFIVVILLSATTFIVYYHMCKISGDGNDLQDSQHQSRRSKRSAINTLVIITLCYAMCFIPLSAININLSLIHI